MPPISELFGQALLHPRLRAGGRDAHVAGYLAIGIAAVAGLGAIVFGLSSFLAGDYVLAGVRAGVLLGSLGLVLVARFIGRRDLLAPYVAALTWGLVTLAVAQSGGATSRGLYQYALVPFLAAGLGNIRSATWSLLVALATVATFYVLHDHGVVFPASGQHALHVNLPSLAISVALVFSMTSLIVRSRRATREQAGHALAAVAHANARAQSARARVIRAHRANHAVVARVGADFHASLASLSRHAQAVSDRLPPSLAEHAAMVARGAADLLAKLERFVSYAQAPAVPVDPLTVAARDRPTRPRPAHEVASFGPLRRRFWARVDRDLHGSFRRADPERRGRARAVAAVLMIFFGVGLLTSVQDAFVVRAEPLVGLATALAGLVMLLVLHRSRALGGIVIASTGVLILVGVGQIVFRHEPGDPMMAWLLVLGLTPMFYEHLLGAIAAVIGAFVIASLVASPVPLVPSVTPIGDIVGLCVTAWAAMVVVVDTHVMALGEFESELRTQRKLEPRLDAAAQRLSTAAHATQQLLTAFSHELRSPLNGVVGLADLLLDDPDAAGVRPELERLRSAGRSVVRAVDSLLCLARTHADGVETPELIDLTGMLEAVAARATHETPDAALACRVAADCPRVLNGPRATLGACLEQVVGSALEGGVAPLMLTASFADRRIVVDVHGRLGRTASDEARSALGLGEALVATLAEAAGGDAEATQDGSGVWRLVLRLPGDAVARPGAISPRSE